MEALLVKESKLKYQEWLYREQCVSLLLRALSFFPFSTMKASSPKKRGTADKPVLKKLQAVSSSS